MAEVRVTCPMCQAELAIDEEHLGKEIECGSCLQPFVAEDPKTKKKPYKMRRDDKDTEDDEEDRPKKKKKRRRRDDDEDDYDYSPPGYSDGGGGGNGLAVTSLIFGILSFPLLCCCHLNVVASLVGIATGAIGLSKPSGRGLALTGLILSIVSLLLYVGMLVVGFGFNAMNANNFK